MIGIIDYGMGNLRSVQKAFERAGYPSELVEDPDRLANYQGVVLPGVGAFGQAMANLERSGLKDAILELINNEHPLLGICLGLQLLFSESEESFGQAGVRGLGVIPGKVRKFPAQLKVPQIGWNQLEFNKAHPLIKGISPGAYVYFVHSYYVKPEDSQVVLSTTEYGTPFVSSIAKDNLCAIQFHPEKSSILGLQILKNFGEMAYANNPRN